MFTHSFFPTQPHLQSLSVIHTHLPTSENIKPNIINICPNSLLSPRMKGVSQSHRMNTRQSKKLASVQGKPTDSGSSKKKKKKTETDTKADGHISRQRLSQSDRPTDRWIDQQADTESETVTDQQTQQTHQQENRRGE